MIATYSVLVHDKNDRHALRLLTVVPWEGLYSPGSTLRALVGWDFEGKE